MNKTFRKVFGAFKGSEKDTTISAAPQQSVFGIRLDELLIRTSTTDSSIPPILDHITLNIEEYGMCFHIISHHAHCFVGIEQEGLYRVSGSVALLQQLKKAYDGTSFML